MKLTAVTNETLAFFNSPEKTIIDDRQILTLCFLGHKI